jgi:hypothetical protein
MAVEECKYVCANIEQNFKWNTEKPQARRNIGLAPFCDTVFWYDGTHTVTAEEVTNEKIEIEIGQLPEVIRTSGKSFIAKCYADIRETSTHVISHGEHGIMTHLISAGGTLNGMSANIMSDFNGDMTAFVTPVLPFIIYPTSYANTFKIVISPPPGVIPDQALLLIRVKLQYIQAF